MALNNLLKLLPSSASRCGRGSIPSRCLPPPLPRPPPSQGTQADFKNELLFSQFGINYNKLPERYRKASRVVAQFIVVPQETNKGGPGVGAGRRTGCLQRERYGEL